MYYITICVLSILNIYYYDNEIREIILLENNIPIVDNELCIDYKNKNALINSDLSFIISSADNYYTLSINLDNAINNKISKLDYKNNKDEITTLNNLKEMSGIYKKSGLMRRQGTEGCKNKNNEENGEEVLSLD